MKLLNTELHVLIIALGQALGNGDQRQCFHSNIPSVQLLPKGSFNVLDHPAVSAAVTRHR